MSGSRDPSVTIVNPTEIPVMYGYVTWRMTTEFFVMYGSEGVKLAHVSFWDVIRLKVVTKTLVGLYGYHGDTQEHTPVKMTPRL